MNRGQRYTLTIERPAAGGRMIARHDGAIVFVSGRDSGRGRRGRSREGAARHGVGDRAERSSSRRPIASTGAPDGACGGSVLAHIAYQRQRQIKSEIITDAFRRIGRIPLEAATEVVASPADGYRMRARLHVRDGRIGFFREGTHSLCDAAATRQLRDDTIDGAAPARDRRWPRRSGTPSATSNCRRTSMRRSGPFISSCCRTRIRRGSPRWCRSDGVTGATCAHGDNPRTIDLFGSPFVTDTIAGAQLSRHVRSFFQGNRFLTTTMVEHVLGLLAAAPILDLYAGVGLFSVTAAAASRGHVTAVEGDRSSAADLKRNAHGHATSACGPMRSRVFSSGPRIASAP